jgi:hypothetical protein
VADSRDDILLEEHVPLINPYTFETNKKAY